MGFFFFFSPSHQGASSVKGELCAEEQDWQLWLCNCSHYTITHSALEAGGPCVPWEQHQYCDTATRVSHRVLQVSLSGDSYKDGNLASNLGQPRGGRVRGSETSDPVHPTPSLERWGTCSTARRRHSSGVHGAEPRPEPLFPNFHSMLFQPYPYPTASIFFFILWFTLYKDSLFEFLHLYNGRVAPDSPV